MLSLLHIIRGHIQFVAVVSLDLIGENFSDKNGMTFVHGVLITISFR